MPTKAKELRPEKVEAVKELKEKFQKAKIAIFTEYQIEKQEGLQVKEVQQLRRKLLQGKGEFKVVKNTLARKALAELKIKELDKFLERASAIAFGYDDPAVAAKALVEFVKEVKREKNMLPLVKAAWFEERVLDVTQVRFLASLPPRDVLLSQFLGTMKAPVTGLVTVLSGTLRSFVTVLDAIRKNKPVAPAEQPVKQEEKPPAAEAPQAQAEPPAPSAPAAEPPEEKKDNSTTT